MILVDTGPLVAAASRSDAHNAACVAALQAARPPRLVPGLVIAEVCILLARDGSAAVEAEFLRAFGTGFLKVIDLTTEDLDRCAELYSDLPLGGTDACLIALAERLHIAEIATLDRRHFTVVRPRHTESFTLLP